MFHRGQAFDVFKLLIAAVVAIALLTVLLPIIGNIGGIGQNEPNNTAAQAMKDLVNQPSLHRLTDKVVFKQDDSLNATAIADKTNVLSRDQVCVLPGEFESETEVFESASDALVRYVGTGNRTVKLSIMCDAGGALVDDVELNGLSEEISNASSCSCTQRENQTCCLVAIRKT